MDRKPEYIGRNISFCPQKPESMEKIKNILSDLITGKKEAFYYEAQRGDYKLGVTVSPFDMNGERVGFIQCFSIIH